MSKQILKLYASNILTGLVFWYGIEKLFMINIGIDTVGIGIATAILATFTLIFNVPAGMLADKWSRKGMLVIAATSLAFGSTILALSNNLPMYIFGYLFFGIYGVAANGTYQAIIYDSLSEEDREKEYSKIMGHIYGFYLIGLTGATAFSGFIASNFSYQATFFISVIPCIVNVILLLTLHEPKLHKSKTAERTSKQVTISVKAALESTLLRSLVIILNTLIVVEVFKNFGQLYIAEYINTPQIIGILWGAYTFARSLGSFFAHRFKDKLSALILFSTAPLIAMALINSWVGIILFMVQTIAFSALNNRIETIIQENTPSRVRASVLSILSSAGKAISIPASLAIGWAISEYSILTVLQFIALICVALLIYWTYNRLASTKQSPNL